MTIQQLINTLSEFEHREAEVLIQCPSFGKASMFQKLETVEENKARNAVLNTPGFRLPESVEGCSA